MRGLVILVAVLQAAIVVLLLYLLTDGRHGAQTAPEPRWTTVGTTGLDEASLRRIIREELAQMVNEVPPAVPSPQFRDHFADRERRESIERQMAYFRSLNEVPAAEMSRLTADIAQLPPADRTALLAELARAINAGEIRGLQ